MSDEIEALTETAKAVQEVAKTGRTAIEAGSELGKFLAKMLGTVPEDVVGLAGGDYLRMKRMKNIDRIFDKAEKRLAGRGVEEPDAIDLKYTQPLLEAVSEESDETLQDMWANLIANAMDPNHTAKFQRVFIETLKQLEPLDAKVLEAFHGYAAGTTATKHTQDRFFKAEAKNFFENEDAYTLSTDHLAQLGLIVKGESSVVGGGSLGTTALGRELLRATAK